MRYKFLLFCYLFFLKIFLIKKKDKFEWLIYKTFNSINIKNLNENDMYKFFTHSKINRINSFFLKRIFKVSKHIDIDMSDDRKPNSSVYEMN